MSFGVFVEIAVEMLVVPSFSFVLLEFYVMHTLHSPFDFIILFRSDINLA